VRAEIGKLYGLEGMHKGTNAPTDSVHIVFIRVEGKEELLILLPRMDACKLEECGYAQTWDPTPALRGMKDKRLWVWFSNWCWKALMGGCVLIEVIGTVDLRWMVRMRTSKWVR